MLTVSRHYPVEQRERAMKVVLDHLSEYRSVYAAFVVDCYSGAIVGWQAATVENTAMVTTALKISFAEAIVLERITASIGRVGGNNRRLHSQLNYLPPEEYEAPTTPHPGVPAGEASTMKRTKSGMLLYRVKGLSGRDVLRRGFGRAVG
jgi:hypothetical protein